jgi:hypothetical protein
MAGYVYLIGTPVFNWYKIGKSRVPEIRIQDLGILLPFKVEIIGIWKAENHTMMESMLHVKYANRRINGEWFHFYRTEITGLFSYLPSSVRVFPSDNSPNSVFARFSNIERDCPEGKKIHVSVRKIKNVDMTDEERARLRQKGVEEHRRKKALRDAQTIIPQPEK